MNDVRDVANFLIEIGHDSSEGESIAISPLRLQKLLYYCQGWSLALLDRPLFHQPIEAWKFGPAVHDIYRSYSGSGPIARPTQSTRTQFATKDAELMMVVWRHYAAKTPNELVRMTHSETPWLAARGNLPEDASSNALISHESMRSYFKDFLYDMAKAATPQGCPVVDPAEVWQAEERLEKGLDKSVPAEKVFGNLIAQCGGK